MVKRIREIVGGVPSAIIAVLLVVLATVTAVNYVGGSGSADGFACPNTTSTDIPAGTFSPTEKVAVVVREVDFRGTTPVVFYYVRYVDAGQKVEFGKGVNGTSQNRDGWIVGDDIQLASCESAKLALADAKGNIPDAVVWLQVECPRAEVLEAARNAGLTVKDWDDTDKENWFIQVTDEVDAQFVLVCDANAPATTVPASTVPSTTVATTPTTIATTATTARPAATVPTTVAAVTTTTMKPAPANLGGTPTTGNRLTGDCSSPAHTDGHIRSVDNGATASKGTLVVLRQVDNADGIEFIEAGCLTQDVVAGKNGLNAHDLWTGYSSGLKASSDACGQAIGDLRGSKVSGSWNNTYDVRFMDGNGFGPTPATCPAR